jgi:hypothetical protein
LIWLVPRLYTAATAAIRQRPLVAAGWGVVACVGYVVLLVIVVIAMILLAIAFGLLGFGDLVGISIVGGIVVIAAATLVFLVAAAYVADAIVGAALAGLVVRGPSPTRARELAILAAGAAVVVAVTSLPILGPWVKLVVVLLGIGALLVAIRQERSPGGAAATSAAPATSAEP